MPDETINSEPITPPIFQLGQLFKSEKVLNSPISQIIHGTPHPNWIEAGLGVEPFDSEDKKAIILSLFQDELRPKVTFENGYFISLISSPEIFKLICSKIDELRPIKSPEEFFYNVLMANELFEMFLNALGHNHQTRQGGRDQRLSLEQCLNYTSQIKEIANQAFEEK